MAITQIDNGVGEIIQKLKEKNLYEDTLILYTSDHGDYMGYHHMLLKSNHMYEPLMKIPLIIKYPGSPQPKQELALSSNVDVAAEILTACGMTPGVNMSHEGLVGREMVIAEFNSGEYMVRSHRYKLILENEGGSVHFFDLKEDPLELTDLGADHTYRDILQKHKDFLFTEILFRHPSKAYLDYNAASIRPISSNALERDRAEMSEYFRQSM